MAVYELSKPELRDEADEYELGAAFLSQPDCRRIPECSSVTVSAWTDQSSRSVISARRTPMSMMFSTSSSVKSSGSVSRSRMSQFSVR